MQPPPSASWLEFSKLYCSRQVQTPEGLLSILQSQRAKYNPEGWFMAECEVMDSSRFGSLVILPYGPRNTFKTVPTEPFSPRGLASDMSVSILSLPANLLPA